MTWILPKQLHTLVSALDTEALISDLSEQSQICAQSLLVRSKVTLARTWSQKWKRDTWTQHLSGRILKPSLGKSFAEKWTSSLADTHASHSAPPESASAKTILATSGPLLQMELDSCSPEFVFSRTLKDTSLSDSEQSLKNWEAWVMKCRGEYLARAKLALRTRENGSSSWPTITVNESKNSSSGSQADRNTPPLGIKVLLADSMCNRDKTRISEQKQRHERITGIINHGSHQDAWPSRPSEHQYGWEPPRVVGNSASARGKESGDLACAGQGYRSTRSGGGDDSLGQTQPPLGGDTNGASGGMDYAELCISCDNRTDELRLLGNGVVPATATRAFLTLLNEQRSGFVWRSY